MAYQAYIGQYDLEFYEHQVLITKTSKRCFELSEATKILALYLNKQIAEPKLQV